MLGIGKDYKMARFFKILLVVVVSGLILAGCNGKQKTATGEKISDKELSGEQEQQKEVNEDHLDRAVLVSAAKQSGF